MTGNLAILQHFFNINWGHFIVTEPTWIAREALTKRLSGDHIIYWDATPGSTPIDYNRKWINRRHEFKFLLQSETRQNVLEMITEIELMLHNDFHPGPWFPAWNGDEDNVLCHLDLNEGAGNPADSTDNNYDFTNTNGTWVTTGGIHEKNYMKFNNNEFISNGTLLDVVPAAYTIEVVFKLDSDFYSNMTASRTVVYKHNIQPSPESILIQVNVTYDNKCYLTARSPGATDLNVGQLPQNRWVSVMATHSPRGLEFYLNGMCLHYDQSATDLMGDGTNDQFYVGSGNAGGCPPYLHVQRLRVSQVARLPYDYLYLGPRRTIETRKGLYQCELTVVGELSNVFIGGNL